MRQLERSLHIARGDSLTPKKVACGAWSKASGIWDVRHAFNANVVYELPFGAGKALLNQPEILRSVFSSWQMTSILSAHKDELCDPPNLQPYAPNQFSRLLESVRENGFCVSSESF